MDGPAECMPGTDPLQVQAAQACAVELAAGRAVGGAIRTRLRVGRFTPCMRNDLAAPLGPPGQTAKKTTDDLVGVPWAGTCGGCRDL